MPRQINASVINPSAYEPTAVCIAEMSSSIICRVPLIVSLYNQVNGFESGPGVSLTAGIADDEELLSALKLTAGRPLDPSPAVSLAVSGLSPFKSKADAPP